MLERGINDKNQYKQTYFLRGREPWGGKFSCCIIRETAVVAFSHKLQALSALNLGCRNGKSRSAKGFLSLPQFNELQSLNIGDLLLKLQLQRFTRKQQRAQNLQSTEKP